MRHFYIVACSLVAFGLSIANAGSAQTPNVSGVWKPLSGDDRLMTIRMSNGKITIEARDLRCTLTGLQAQPRDASMNLPSVIGNSVCDEESETTYAKETFTLLRSGQDEFLINATVLIRVVDESAEPKLDETYTNRPADITIYRKVRRR